MMHFLVVYDRPAGQMLEFTRFHNRGAALKARFDAERQHRGNDAIEVVVLNADSEETLHRTHARYFSTMREILESGLRAVDRRQDS